MSKTDKEMAVELVITAMTSWNGSDRTRPMQPSEIPDLLAMYYNALRALDTAE